MSSSPYEPPQDVDGAARNTDSQLPTGNWLTLAQIALRLLGVMFVLDGAGAIFGGLVHGVLQARAYAASGYPWGADPYSVGWAAAGIPYLIAGVYLLVGGKWLLLNLIVPASLSGQRILFPTQDQTEANQ